MPLALLFNSANYKRNSKAYYKEKCDFIKSFIIAGNYSVDCFDVVAGKNPAYIQHLTYIN